MRLIHINTQPTEKQLHQFGLAWFVFFMLLAAILGWKGFSSTTLICLAAIAVIFPAVGWKWLPFMRIVYLGMSFAAYPIGFLISHLILFMIYYGIITPTGLTLRLTKRDFFPKKPNPKETSYWIKTKGRPRLNDYFKPF